MELVQKAWRILWIDYHVFTSQSTNAMPTAETFKSRKIQFLSISSNVILQERSLLHLLQENQIEMYIALRDI